MGAPRGVRQQRKDPVYDPASGLPYRPGASFRGDVAMKLIRMALRANISTSELLNELVRRAEVDETGLPVWMADPNSQEGRLPLEAPSDVTAA